MNTLASRNSNTLWCSVLVETLVQEGLRHVVVSPGSRSTALTVAFVAHEAVNVIPVLDERSAGFFALGLARRSHQAVVLVCTSGSAAAHYLPAIIEAHESGGALIVISADRPPELRDCASGQTIDQHKLFGNYASWFHELALPEANLGLLRYLRQTMRQAWRRAATRGPVHLNAPFRDPLPPLCDDGASAKVAAQIQADFFQYDTELRTTEASLRLHQRITTTRGVMIAGPAQTVDAAHYVERIAALARATGWPILADVLSPLRQATPAGITLITSYDTILRNDTLARDLTPRFVIALESWPTSKVLRQWLESSQAEMLMISPRAGSRDAIHGKTREITAAATALVIDGAAPADPSYVNAWRDSEQRVRGALDHWFEKNPSLIFEGRVAWLLGKHAPDGSAVCVANSMPVRDLEYFWSSSNRGLEVYSSRGGNGIDGTLSTAIGVAHESGRPTFLLTGDLAFLHDSNGLMLAKELSGNLTVIVINNDGGGIFEHLPISQFEPPFERYFATPQSVDLGALCAAHKVDFERVDGWPALLDVINNPSASGLRVREVATDRKADAALRKRLFRDAAKTK